MVSGKLWFEFKNQNLIISHISFPQATFNWERISDVLISGSQIF